MSRRLGRNTFFNCHAQEFDNREAAEESVAKYHEGYFMGNKIRVELSRGGRTAKFNGDPGACFKCGDLGHWARYVAILFAGTELDYPFGELL